jgi:O-antigen ligase/polysaccharide polymerase Wzy-like membrane protein
MRDKSLAKLAFALFLLTTATLFLRPAELFIWMADTPIYEILILATLALTFQSVLGHFRQFMLARQPISLCVVGVFLAIGISHLQHIYLGALIDSGTLFLKTLVYFGLLVTVVNTPSRLKAFLLTVAICSSTMVTLCVLDFYDIYDFEFIEHLDDNDGFDEDEDEVITVRRMRGTGIFMDPNDLTAVICATGVICSFFLTDPSASRLRLAWLIPMIVQLIGILATGSRGGLLACLLSGMTLLAVRYGGKLAIVAAVMGACLIPFAIGRQGGIGFEEGGTGQERIQLWRDGLHELKSSAIVFGTGQGSYGDIVGLVAHNSFIHAYVELGLFGGTMFFGCFFFAGMQLYRMGRLTEPVQHSELVRLRPFMCALLAGWVTSIMSLSRCYVVPTYLILGIVASYLNLVWIYTESGEPLVIWDRGHAVRLGFASGMFFSGLYVITAIIAR